MLFETGSCPNRAFHLIDENPLWWSAIRKLGTKNKRCRRFLQRSFTRYRFACIRFSPTSRCTTSGRLTYLRTATALPFLNFFAGRVRAESTDFRQWPARLSVFGFFLATLKTVWRKTLRRAKIPYFRIYDLRSTYATRLSAGGVADEWVTQMLRQGDAQVFKKYSQMKLQMKREALGKLNRRASEIAPVAVDVLMAAPICTVAVQ
jgi:hypothetical protein